MTSLDEQIKKLQAEISSLHSQKKAETYRLLKPMEKKFYQNKDHSDDFFFVDFISKDSFRPIGYRIFYKDFRSDIMDDPNDWEEISKEVFIKGLEEFISVIKENMQL